MDLTEHERRTLREIERRLAREDPAFARALAAGRLPRPLGVRTGWSLLWCGIVMLGVGLVLGAPTVTLVGILIVTAFPIPVHLSRR
jgi:hypothetical protein